MCVFYVDIPDDEAEYWTGKLDRINTMGIHDEVKCNLTRFDLYSYLFQESTSVYSY